MDVDPTELIPSVPPAGKAPAAQALVAIDDMDLEDDSATLMFKRPEPPPGPPRRPPPPKAKPPGPPDKSGSKLPLPAPTRADKPVLASPKAGERPAAPPPKPVAKTPALKADEKPMFPPSVSAPPEPKLSERPLFEVTLGSEMPLLATPDAQEISLLAPRAPGMPLLATPQRGDVGSFDLKPGAGAISPLPGLPMLDFSRDVSGMNRSSPPNRVGTRVVGYARMHAKWLMMAGGTVLIGCVSWMVFQAAASSSEPATAGSARGAIAGAHALAASPTTRPAVTAQPVAAAQPVASPEPAAPPSDPAPAEKADIPEAPAATAPAERAANAAEAAIRPGAAAPEVEPPAPAERPERPAPVAAAEPVARPSGSRSTSTHSTEPAAELPAAKPAPEPVPAPAAPVAAPSVGGFDGTADFDQSAAMAALRQAAEGAKRCQTPDAPSGGVRIAVTFARSGGVSATQVEGPAAGTPLGDCVVAKFQAVHVPPFRGSVMTVRKTVTF
jgi:chemotaxis protein MotD